MPQSSQSYNRQAVFPNLFEGRGVSGTVVLPGGSYHWAHQCITMDLQHSTRKSGRLQLWTDLWAVKMAIIPHCWGTLYPWLRSIQQVGFSIGVLPIFSYIQAAIATSLPSSLMLSSVKEVCICSTCFQVCGLPPLDLRHLPTPFQQRCNQQTTRDYPRHLDFEHGSILPTPECAEAAGLLKSQLTSPPIFTHCDLASNTVVTCDASALAMGDVLSQIQDEVECAIAFASRALQSNAT